MKCFKCNVELPDDAKFCPICGQNAKGRPNFCKHCGKQVDDTMKFCEGCGNPIENLEQKEEEKNPPIISLEDVMDTTKEIVDNMQGDSNPRAHFEEMASKRAANTQTETVFHANSSTKPSVQTQTPHYAPASVHDEASARMQSADDMANPGNATTAETSAAQAQPATPAETPAVNTQPETSTETTEEPQTRGNTQSPAKRQAAAPRPSSANPVSTPVPNDIPEVMSGANFRSRKSGATDTLIRTGGEVLKGTAKSASKAGKVAQTVAIWTAVVAFVIGAAAACLNFFVPAPEDTVEKLVVSVEELDYENLLSCFDSKTEKQVRAALGITGDLLGSLTGISVDLEDLMAFAPEMAPYLEIPDLGIASAETILYADCSKPKIMEYCITANNGGSIPTGYLSDNAIVNFLTEYNISLPGLENFIAEAAIVKITLTSGEVGYFPLINEGYGDWRIPMMDMLSSTN